MSGVDAPARWVLAGVLVGETAAQLREALVRAAPGPTGGLVVDLQEVTALQPEGLAELFDQLERASLTLLVRRGSCVATVVEMCGLGLLAHVELRPARPGSDRYLDDTWT
jgi:anti-anti-sigma regulatory factor